MKIIKQDDVKYYIENNIPIKIRIPEGEDNLKIQQKLNLFGCVWFSGDLTIDIDYMYGILIRNRTMTYTQIKNNFDRKDSHKELDYDLFLKL